MQANKRSEQRQGDHTELENDKHGQLSIWKWYLSNLPCILHYKMALPEYYDLQDTLRMIFNFVSMPRDSFFKLSRAIHVIYSILTKFNQ